MKQQSTWGGPGRGGGRPSNIAGALDRLERSIAAQQRRQARRPLRYAEAEALRQRLDAAHEALERLVTEAPDYPAD